MKRYIKSSSDVHDGEYGNVKSLDDIQRVLNDFKSFNNTNSMTKYSVLWYNIDTGEIWTRHYYTSSSMDTVNDTEYWRDDNIIKLNRELGKTNTSLTPENIQDFVATFD